MKVRVTLRVRYGGKKRKNGQRFNENPIFVVQGVKRKEKENDGK